MCALLTFTGNFAPLVSGVQRSTMPGETARLYAPLSILELSSGVWWSLLLDIRYLWRHIMTSCWRFPNQCFGEVCWHNLHIVLHALSFLAVVQCVTAIVATSPVVLHWLCDSPLTGCARRTKIYMRGASNSKRDCDPWSLLLLAAAVRSFAHMPLGISDRSIMNIK